MGTIKTSNQWWHTHCLEIEAIPIHSWYIGEISHQFLPSLLLAFPFPGLTARSKQITAVNLHHYYPDFYYHSLVSPLEPLSIFTMLTIKRLARREKHIFKVMT